MIFGGVDIERALETRPSIYGIIITIAALLSRQFF
jgi:hypothetical protein